MTQGLNLVDLAIAVLGAFFLLRALLRGFVREVLGLLGLVAAVLLSAAFYQPLGGFLERVAGMPGSYWYAVAFASILVVVFVAFTYLGLGLARLIHAGPFSLLDRLLGGAVGLAKGLLVCYLLLNLLLFLTPLATPEAVRNSTLAPHLVRYGRLLVDLIPGDLTRLMQEKSGLLPSPGAAPGK